MAQRISITLPDESFSALIKMADFTDSTTEELVKRSVEVYIRKNRNLFEAMKKGYGEMGEVNREIADEFLAADNESLLHYEEKLSESE